MPRLTTAEDNAGNLLVHYIRCAWLASGLPWDGDNEAEVRTAVAYLIDAARATES